MCCVPAENPYLEKFLFLRYEPKCSQPIRLLDFLNQPYIQNKLMKQLDFLCVDANPNNSKADQKFFDGHGQKWAWLFVMGL